MELDMPEITKCFGTFPPKYATYLISIFGMGSGGTGLAGLILYGLVESSILSQFVGPENFDESIRKAILVTVGFTSLLLTVANVILFLGVISVSRGTVGTAVWILFVMCMILIFAAIAAPVSCFFLATTCIIKKVSMTITILGILIMTVFLQIWLYFMVVAHNYGSSI